MTMPGVQKPHWMAVPWPGRDSVAKATISGSSSASPSTVKMSAPSAWAASTMQESTGRLSMMTVQAPHAP